uniref:Hydroxymethylglutaryl-CoA synthase 2 n=1 Tax=Blattella germanica TaxID=6973 RepID=HMCS2_BLAGE|nr:RecName: Full=Hydroxymethylglutaryl-CoA synthase 2; Short=HMG-CoA synthase 2; AltName: Full=3-hydroxy-3-methylglutaryl coenzyme A synthase 2 [Blattella germanica]CAA54652.1 hydroxymethylglutaryl-CoA synthase [Blattella germanica]
MAHWPEDVGIIGIEMIFPSLYVDQAELETYDEVSPGKYTMGLGQDKMGVCTDREDINSLCLTAVDKLMERNNIDYNDIGWLEVGTETILDKVKSVKTVLMQLFEESGNTDVEGIDTINACYRGTAALFNALIWIESSSWDGRYAIVVAADIAIYAKECSPTGGAGALLMLIGANAPIVIDRGVRASHMKHAYDFYKPDLMSEYPVVDGKLSVQCYLSALDHCYPRFCSKTEKYLKRCGKENTKIDLDYFDAFVFHSPYCKLVQKSVARLVLNDFIQYPEKYQDLQQLRNLKFEDTYFDRDIEKIFMDKSKQLFEKKTKPSLMLANQVGNMYTTSLYGGLVSLLISEDIGELAGKCICMFSYGSGFAASMFSLHISTDSSPGSTLSRLVTNLTHIKPQVQQRVKLSPGEFENIMEIREQNHHKAPYTPVASPNTLFPGTWYLESIDSMHRRKYKRV